MRLAATECASASPLQFAIPLSRLQFTAWCKKTLPLFEFPALAAAWQTDQPMHSQSANFEKFKLNSLNLAGFFSLHPVLRGPVLGCIKSTSWPQESSGLRHGFTQPRTDALQKICSKNCQLLKI